MIYGSLIGGRSDVLWPEVLASSSVNEMLRGVTRGRAFAVQNGAQYESARTIANQKVRVKRSSGDEGLLLCHASRPLDSPHTDVECLIVVVHGALRNSDLYLAHAEAAAGKASLSTLVVAPQFLARVDVDASIPVPDGALFWDVEGWKGGAPAVKAASISSFTAMDRLLLDLTKPARARRGRKPSVVVIGNSAGGQFVNRYAAVGHAPDTLADDGIRVRFVIANPSTYLYFDETRPVEVRGRGVNRWRYGFEDTPPYVISTPEQSLARYVQRDVSILLGAEDHDESALLLEVSPAAMAQGRNRLERGLKYHEHVGELARRAGLKHKHKLRMLNGVGHDAALVLDAPQTRDIMFG
jgi:pimeloyl-ACP methyl ester carboxylesterase